MAIQTFGVTAASVKNRYFPNSNPFTAFTKPTSSDVADIITEQASTVAGALLLKDVDASTLLNTSPAYASCAMILRLMVATVALNSMTGQDPELAKKWQRQIDKWFKDLETLGLNFLGDPTLLAGSVNNPDGPTTFIKFYNVDVGDETDVSTLEPRLRRDDML